jgi:hypothetical protein
MNKAIFQILLLFSTCAAPRAMDQDGLKKTYPKPQYCTTVLSGPQADHNSMYAYESEHPDEDKDDFYTVDLVTKNPSAYRLDNKDQKNQFENQPGNDSDSIMNPINFNELNAILQASKRPSCWQKTLNFLCCCRTKPVTNEHSFNITQKNSIEKTQSQHLNDSMEQALEKAKRKPLLTSGAPEVESLSSNRLMEETLYYPFETNEVPSSDNPSYASSHTEPRQFVTMKKSDVEEIFLSIGNGPKSSALLIKSPQKNDSITRSAAKEMNAHLLNAAKSEKNALSLNDSQTFDPDFRDLQIHHEKKSCCGRLAATLAQWTHVGREREEYHDDQPMRQKELGSAGVLLAKPPSARDTLSDASKMLTGTVTSNDKDTFLADRAFSTPAMLQNRESNFSNYTHRDKNNPLPHTLSEENKLNISKPDLFTYDGEYSEE